MPDMTYAVHTGTCTYLLDDDGICLWTLSPGGHAAPGTDRCVGAQFVACLDLTTPGGLVGELCIGAAALFARREHGRFVLLRTLPIERVEYRAQTEDVRAYRDVLTSQDATAVLAAHEADVLLAGDGTAMPAPQATSVVPAYPLPQQHAPAPQQHAPVPQRTAPLPQQTAPAPRQHAPLPQQHAHPQRAYTPAPQHAPEPEVLRTAPLPDQPWPPRVPAAARAAREAPRPAPASLQLTYETYGDEQEVDFLDSEDLVSVSVTEVAITQPLYRPPPGAPPAPLPDYVLPPPAAPPRQYAPPPAAARPAPAAPEAEGSGPPTPRGPPPARRGVVGPGRRLR